MYPISSLTDVMSEMIRASESNILRRAPNDNEATPVRAVCTNLEGLVGNLDALESGFNDLVERSRMSSPVPLRRLGPRSVFVIKQAGSGISRELALDDPHTVTLKF